MIDRNRSRTFSWRALIPAACLLAGIAFADDYLKPPPEGAFLASMMKVADNWVLDYQPYEELEFPAMNGEAHPMKRGKHWRLWGDLEKPNDGPNSWAYLKPGFLKAGWTVAKEVEPSVRQGSVHYLKNGLEAWATVDITGSRVEVHVIEVGPVPVSLTLNPPAATPEKMDPATGDFPYLPPIPGSTFQGGTVDPDPGRAKNRRRGNFQSGVRGGEVKQFGQF